MGTSRVSVVAQIAPSGLVRPWTFSSSSRTCRASEPRSRLWTAPKPLPVQRLSIPWIVLWCSSRAGWGDQNELVMEWVKPSICRRDNGNEGEWFMTAIADAVHTPFGSDDHIPSCDSQGITRRFRLVIALTGENCPGVLPSRMHVGSDSLAWLDVPRDNRSLRSFRDH